MTSNINTNPPITVMESNAPMSDKAKDKDNNSSSSLSPPPSFSPSFLSRRAEANRLFSLNQWSLSHDLYLELSDDDEISLDLSHRSLLVGNAALCQFKLGNHSLCQQLCLRALTLDPTNLKSFCRLHSSISLSPHSLREELLSSRQSIIHILSQRFSSIQTEQKSENEKQIENSLREIIGKIEKRIQNSQWENNNNNYNNNNNNNGGQHKDASPSSSPFDFSSPLSSMEISSPKFSISSCVSSLKVLLSHISEFSHRVSSWDFSFISFHSKAFLSLDHRIPEAIFKIITRNPSTTTSASIPTNTSTTISNPNVYLLSLKVLYNLTNFAILTKEKFSEFLDEKDENLQIPWIPTVISHVDKIIESLRTHFPTLLSEIIPFEISHPNPNPNENKSIEVTKIPKFFLMKISLAMSAAGKIVETEIVTQKKMKIYWENIEKQKDKREGEGEKEKDKDKDPASSPSHVLPPLPSTSLLIPFVDSTLRILQWAMKNSLIGNSFSPLLCALIGDIITSLSSLVVRIHSLWSDLAMEEIHSNVPSTLSLNPFSSFRLLRSAFLPLFLFCSFASHQLVGEMKKISFDNDVVDTKENPLEMEIMEIIFPSALTAFSPSSSPSSIRRSIVSFLSQLTHSVDALQHSVQKKKDLNQKKQNSLHLPSTPSSISPSSPSNSSDFSEVFDFRMKSLKTEELARIYSDLSILLFDVIFDTKNPKRMEKGAMAMQIMAEANTNIVGEILKVKPNEQIIQKHKDKDKESKEIKEDSPSPPPLPFPTPAEFLLDISSYDSEESDLSPSSPSPYPSFSSLNVSPSLFTSNEFPSIALHFCQILSLCSSDEFIRTLIGESHRLDIFFKWIFDSNPKESKGKKTFSQLYSQSLAAVTIAKISVLEKSPRPSHESHLVISSLMNILFLLRKFHVGEFSQLGIHTNKSKLFFISDEENPPFSECDVVGAMDIIRATVEALAFLSISIESKRILCTNGISPKVSFIDVIVHFSVSTDQSIRFGICNLLRNLTTSTEQLKENFNSEVAQLRDIAKKGMAGRANNGKGDESEMSLSTESNPERAGKEKELIKILHSPIQNGLVAAFCNAFRTYQNIHSEYKERAIKGNINILKAKGNPMDSSPTSSSLIDFHSNWSGFSYPLACSFAQSMLFLSSHPPFRGFMVQQGALRLVSSLIELGIHHMESPTIHVDSTSSHLSNEMGGRENSPNRLFLESTHSASRLLISLDPNVIGKDILFPLIPNFLLALQISDHQLLTFEILMALTNLASMGTEMAEEICQMKPKKITSDSSPSKHTENYSIWAEVRNELSDDNTQIQCSALELMANLIGTPTIQKRLMDSVDSGNDNEDIKLFLAFANHEDVRTSVAATSALAMASQNLSIAKLIGKTQITSIYKKHIYETAKRLNEAKSEGETIDLDQIQKDMEENEMKIGEAKSEDFHFHRNGVVLLTSLVESPSTDSQIKMRAEYTLNNIKKSINMNFTREREGEEENLK